MTANTNTGMQIRGNAHSIGLQSNQLVVGGQSSKNEEQRGEKAPRNGEGQRKRKHQRHEGKNGGDRNIRVIDQNVEQLLEEIAEHQHETEDDDPKESRRDHADADIPVNNLHRKPCCPSPAGEDGRGMQLGHRGTVFKRFTRNQSALRALTSLSTKLRASNQDSISGRCIAPHGTMTRAIVPQGGFNLGSKPPIPREQYVLHDLSLCGFIRNRR